MDAVGEPRSADLELEVDDTTKLEALSIISEVPGEPRRRG